MPLSQISRRSGAHRTAALALYRALLAKCRALSPADEERSELRNVVRNRFKHTQYVESARRLRVSFDAGYEAIDLLDAAVAGNEESRSYIVSLLERAPAKIKQAPEPKPIATDHKRTTASSESSELGKKPGLSLFDRPLPLEKLSGRRHVPVLFNANHIPVLRIKKPQPENLSRFIRQRITQRQEWHNRRQRLSEERALASREDEWDRLMEPYGVQSIDKPIRSGSREPKWVNAVDRATEEVQGLLEKERLKNKEMAEKMQAVVDREKVLFEQERAERKELKMQERLEKRRLRDEPAQHQAAVDGEAVEREKMRAAG